MAFTVKHGTPYIPGKLTWWMIASENIFSDAEEFEPGTFGLPIQWFSNRANEPSEEEQNYMNMKVLDSVPILYY